MPPNTASSLLKKGDWLRAKCVFLGENGYRAVPVSLFQRTASAPVSAKINAAVREWLDRIEPGRPPLTHLAAHIVKLREEHGWTDEEIREFDETARHILVRLIRGEASEGESVEGW
jgi:hypothetical protein